MSVLGEMVFQDDCPDLFDLIWLCVRPVLLKIDHLLNSDELEDVMTAAAGPFLEPEAQSRCRRSSNPMFASAAPCSTCSSVFSARDTFSARYHAVREGRHRRTGLSLSRGHRLLH